MKVIFLDIDGVLNDHSTWPSGCGRIQPTPVDRLNTILVAVPDAKIVLISAWRYSFRDVVAIEALLCSHGVACRGRVHGRTDFDPTEGQPKWTEREEWTRLGIRWRDDQIIEYLRVHNEITGYVVLDDLPLIGKNLVRVDGQCGLRSIDAARAVQILRGQE
jgi:hypothetical protein